MAVAYEPGDEIQLAVESKIKFFAKAMSWREQKEHRKAIEALDENDGATEPTYEDRVERLLELSLTRLTKTEPSMELTVDALSDVMDSTTILNLSGAITHNVTYEEKKS